MKEKYLFFATGEGTSNPLAWKKGYSGLFPVSKFLGIRPKDSTTLVFYFEGNTVVELGIRNGLHGKIMKTVGDVISNSDKGVITIADFDGGRFIEHGIESVTL
mgnify:CR=1 FL=1